MFKKEIIAVTILSSFLYANTNFKENIQLINSFENASLEEKKHTSLKLSKVLVSNPKEFFLLFENKDKLYNTWVNSLPTNLLSVKKHKLDEFEQLKKQMLDTISDYRYKKESSEHKSKLVRLLAKLYITKIKVLD